MKQILLLVIILSLMSCGKKVRRGNLESEEEGMELRQSPDSFYVSWSWKNYDNQEFHINYSFSRKDVGGSAENRKKLQASAIVQNAPDYAMMVNYDAEFIKPLANQLAQIARENHFDEKETAEMVVTMIQNITYTLVHSASHEVAEEQARQASSTFVEEYHIDNNHQPFDKSPFGGCEANVDPIGVYSPLEFLSGLKGDCDTRTVTLFALLKALNLDAIVVNGPGHSMLAVPYKPNNPTCPYLIYKGQYYYFWETTIFYNQNGVSGPRIGDILDPNFNSTQWTPVLF